MRTRVPLPTFLAVPVILCGALPQANGQMAGQWLLSPGLDHMQYTRDAVVSADQATVFQVAGDSGLVFVRVDALGTVEWAVRLEPDQNALQSGKAPMAVMPDGGICVLLKRPQMWGGDSVGCDLVRLAVDGSTVWSRLIVLPADGSAIAGDVFGLASNAQGELFLRASQNYGSILMKLDPNGVPLWSDRIWDLALNTFAREIVDVVPLSDGGCAFLAVGDVPTVAGVSVGRIHASGTVLWHQAYTYGAQNVAMLDPALAKGLADDLFVTMRLDLVGLSNNVLLHHIGPSGALLGSDLYEVPDGIGTSDPQAMALGQDDLRIMGWYPVGPFLSRGFMLRIDAQHALLEAVTSVADTVNGRSRTVSGWQGRARDGMAHLIGTFRTRDLTFGTEEFRPTLWRTDGPLSDLCFVEPWAVQHHAVPSGLVTVQTVGTAQTAPGTHMAAGSINTVLQAPALVPFCGETSVQDRREASVDAIHPNPASAGGPVHWPVEGVRVLLRDATGRVLTERPVQPNERTLVLDPDLPPGTYLLQLIGRSPEDGRGWPLVVR